MRLFPKLCHNLRRLATGFGSKPLLSAYLTLGQLLALGAILQLIAQCIRPWSPLPLYCITFFVQSLGMAFQDSHTNTFVSSVPAAHRWLGFIHAMYALGCLVGPLIATAIATNGAAVAVAGGSGIVEESTDEWMKCYHVLTGLGVINIAGVAVGFRDTLLEASRSQEAESGTGGGRTATKNASGGRAALKELPEMLKIKSVWMISLFYFFELGAGATSGGMISRICDIISDSMILRCR